MDTRDKTYRVDLFDATMEVRSAGYHDGYDYQRTGHESYMETSRGGVDAVLRRAAVSNDDFTTEECLALLNAYRAAFSKGMRERNEDFEIDNGPDGAP